ncbi:MAG: hypothetical protein J3R72DRAFT_423161 [Linnemannia gamsii]|nr:MAG: hypothetical protein J3R72DRAFT_423161 [Linnemannia gamsii]
MKSQISVKGILPTIRSMLLAKGVCAIISTIGYSFAMISHDCRSFTRTIHLSRSKSAWFANIWTWWQVMMEKKDSGTRTTLAMGNGPIYSRVPFLQFQEQFFIITILLSTQ